MLIAWIKVDPVKSLIDNAVTAGFGCIDVNIPKAITPGPEDSKTIQHPTEDSPDVARHQSTLLASYIWDNYIAPSDNERVFFIGIGNAFQGIARLLSEKQEVHEMTAGVVAFIANNPLRPVANDNFEIQGGSLAGWYSHNSRVWLSPTHSGLKREKRLGKKFGKVEKSEETVLSLMVKRHMDDAWRWITVVRKPSDIDNDAGFLMDHLATLLGRCPNPEMRTHHFQDMLVDLQLGYMNEKK